MPRIVRKANFTTSKWKNGGGITHEIARSDADVVFGWRLSVAEVASDGPFSLFPGHQRILTVVEGKGMRLVSANAAYHVGHLVPIRFSGDEHIVGKLIDGPCRDFNLIYDPKRFSAEVTVLQGPQKLSACFAVYLVSGSAVSMEEGDLAFLDGAEGFVQTSEDAIALVIHLNPISK
ncbi:MAG: HutD family protein [Aestuariivirga sp.]